MISDKMAKALNDQLNKELASAYVYLAMAGYFEAKSLGGMSNWMFKQYSEENAHAKKIWSYLGDQDRRVSLQKIDEPSNDFSSPIAAFQEALKHEQFITSSINDLVEQAIEEKDHATNGFLQWFVQEQVEEESSVRTIIEKLEMVKEVPHGLIMIDRELSTRQ